MEDMGRTRYMGRGMELLCPLRWALPTDLQVFTNRKLPDSLPCSMILTEFSLTFWPCSFQGTFP